MPELQDLFNAKCEGGHQFPRCSLSLVQCSQQPYYKCSQCGVLAHQLAGETTLLPKRFHFMFLICSLQPGPKWARAELSGCAGFIESWPDWKNEELKETVTTYLNGLATEEFDNGIQKLVQIYRAAQRNLMNYKSQ